MITVNDLAVKLEMNESNDYRGLHIVVVHPSNGNVLVARVFLIGPDSDAFDTFISGDLPEGSIVAAACKDDCIINLSKPGKQWFANMGSQEVCNT